MTTLKKMLGFDSPGDQKVPVRVGDWNALKLALWRGRLGWEIVAHAAIEILDLCAHAPGCPALNDELEPCLKECTDRETRMSALVILNAARTCVPADARKPPEGSTYFAPSREYFSEVIAELAAAQVENEALHEALRRAGVPAPAPPPDEELTPKQLVSTSQPKLEEKNP